MNLELKDLVIVVTGGASGIGAAITRECLEEGASVVVVGRHSIDGCFEKEMSSQPRCTFVEAELGDEAQCRRAVETVAARHSRLDALVNNAGANDSVGLRSGDPARFYESLRHNLLHYYAMAHYALPMLENARGSIVNISSKVALTGQGNTSAYAAANGAKLALTREWAAELARVGIRVNCVVPAEVGTPLYRSWIEQQPEPEEALRRIQSRIPLEHRLTRPEEIAAMVVFLLSPTRAAHITGQQIVVDGGYTHLDRALT